MTLTVVPPTDLHRSIPHSGQQRESIRNHRAAGAETLPRQDEHAALSETIVRHSRLDVAGSVDNAVGPDRWLRRGYSGHQGHT